MKRIGKDLKDFIANYIKDMADGHLAAWEQRYKNYKTIKEVRFDLNVNHDISLEIERAEDELGRKLNDIEYNHLVKRFNIEVCKLSKNYINQ